MATIVKRETGEGTRYQVKVRVLGEKPRSKTFARLTDAKAWAAAVETDLGRGVYVPTTADRRRTLSDLIDVTVRDHLPNKRHARDNSKLETKLGWWKDSIGYVSLDKLSAEVIGECIAGLRKNKAPSGSRIAPATINRYLAALSVACQYAVRTLRWLPDNPVRRIERGAESAGVVRCLSDDERKRLLDAAAADSDPNMHTAIILALATGARVDNREGALGQAADINRRRPLPRRRFGFRAPERRRGGEGDRLEWIREAAHRSETASPNRR